MANFNYDQAAELYTIKQRSKAGHVMGFQRFDSAALAIQHSMEVLSPQKLPGTLMEVDGVRFHYHDIRKLYESKAYPLDRKQKPDEVRNHEHETK